MCILNKIARFFNEAKAEIRDIIYIIRTELDFAFEFETTSEDIKEIAERSSLV
jgi:hypothetical protein